MMLLRTHSICINHGLHGHQSLHALQSFSLLDHQQAYLSDLLVHHQQGSLSCWLCTEQLALVMTSAAGCCCRMASDQMALNQEEHRVEMLRKAVADKVRLCWQRLTAHRVQATSSPLA